MYLTEAEDDGLARVARAQGRSRAAVARDAITEYVTKNAQPRSLSFIGSGNSAERGFPPIDHDHLDDEIARLITERHDEEGRWLSSSTPDP